MRVLIVDDDVALSHMLVRCLTLWGWHADEAPRISAARESFKQGNYDLLISDVDLPDGDGISFSHELLKANPTFPIVVISGNPVNIGRAREAGLAAFLRKPFSLDELRVLIDSKCVEKS